LVPREGALLCELGQHLDMAFGQAMFKRKSGEHLRAGFKFSGSFSRSSLSMLTPRVTLFARANPIAPPNDFQSGGVSASATSGGTARRGCAIGVALQRRQHPSHVVGREFVSRIGDPILVRADYPSAKNRVRGTHPAHGPRDAVTCQMTSDRPVPYTRTVLFKDPLSRSKSAILKLVIGVVLQVVD
jgi:hypothetical protein